MQSAKTVPWIKGRSKVEAPVLEEKQELTLGVKPTLRRSLGLETFPNVQLFRTCLPLADQSYSPATALLGSPPKDGSKTSQEKLKRDLRLAHFTRFSRGPDLESSPVLTGVGKLQLTPWKKRHSL